MAFWQNSTVLYNNRMSRSCISNPELHFQSWAAFPTRPCVLCRAEIQNWAKNLSRIAPCLTFSKGLGQPGSVFCECVLPWCWWADTCSATSSLNRWCDPASMCHVRGTTSQETQSRGNVEGSRSALVSRSCRSPALVMNLGEMWTRTGTEQPGWKWGWSRGVCSCCDIPPATASARTGNLHWALHLFLSAWSERAGNRFLLTGHKIQIVLAD